MNRQENTRRRSLLIGGAIAVAVFVGLLISPLDAWLGQRLSGLVDYVVWDVWHDGKVTWNGVDITLPEGKYKWVKSEKGGLTIVAREDTRRVVVSLSNGNAASFDAKAYVAELCKDGTKCKNIRETRQQIQSETAEILEFLSPAQTGQYEAYLRLQNAKVLVHVIGDSEASRRDGISLVWLISPQLRPAS
jgi:hypothetical protein